MLVSVSPMRIGLFTDTYVPEVNGVVNSVYMLAEGLDARGHEVWVIAPSHPEAPENEERVIRIPSMPLPVLPERRLASPVDIRLGKQIKNLDFDVIHTNSEFIVNHFGFRAHKRYGIPHVHTYHTIWEEYTHYLVPPAFDRPARAAARKLSANLCGRCNRIIAPTLKTKELLVDYGIKTVIDVVPTGVDLARFSPVDVKDSAQVTRLKGLRKKWGLDRFSTTLLMLGRMAPEKSVLELLLAMVPWLKKNPKSGLLMVGGGPQLRELNRLVEALGLGKQVILTGEQPWEDVPDYYRLADVFINNSSTETQGLIFIEALASGVPLVVRHNECLTGIIEDGVSGALVHNEKEFIPAVESLLKGELRRKQIKQGLEAATRVSKESFVSAVEESYLKATQEQRGDV